MNTSVNNCFENEDQCSALLQLREAVQDILQPHHDDQFLLRWLKARNFNLPKAEKMIRESFKFRKRCKVDKILTNYEYPGDFRKYTKSACLGFDKDFSMVRVVMWRKIDCRGFVASLTTLEILMRFVYALEYDLHLVEERKKSHQKYEEKCTYIFDMKNFNSRQFAGRSVIDAVPKVIRMYQDNYPEVLKVIYIINDGWREELLQHMDAGILPAFLGGNLTDPDGDLNCRSILNWNYKIPESYYLTQEQRYRPAEPDMEALTIPRRSSHECPIHVRSRGAVISWLFQTRDCNLRFGLLHRGEEGSSPKAVLPMAAVDCHVAPVRGQFVCEKVGWYVLHFDNTYSWLTAKHLLYKVKIQEPGSESIVIP